MNLEAVIEQVSMYRGREGETVRVIARYEEAGTIGSLTMDFPQASARSLYVGATLAVNVTIAEARP